MNHTTVGDDCVIGHIVHLEGCIIENFAQVSSGSVVLHRAVISTGAIVAANAVVLNDTFVPAGALAVGAPAVIKEGRARLADIELAVSAYLHKGKRFREQLRRID
jgi:carbonic anhydrase/acetyltransferase-like protein (isoleucine patch superfamily)